MSVTTEIRSTIANLCATVAALHAEFAPHRRGKHFGYRRFGDRIPGPLRRRPELRAGGNRHQSLRDGAAIELGLRSFLENGGFGAFAPSFEDLGASSSYRGLRCNG